mmetsp:Transcript_49845/g.117226  ORF Transcript_49845/g.117226 Transcript_49845/m.117226 type:complete len:221 (-) Transcript_49845:735-1397(-)
MKFLLSCFTTGAVPAWGKVDTEASWMRATPSFRAWPATVAAVRAKPCKYSVSMSLILFRKLRGGTVCTIRMPRHLMTSPALLLFAHFDSSSPMVSTAFNGGMLFAISEPMHFMTSPKPPRQFARPLPIVIAILIGAGQFTLFLPKLKSNSVSCWPMSRNQHFCLPKDTLKPSSSTLTPGAERGLQPALKSVKPRDKMSTAISTVSTTVSATKATGSVARS